MLLFVGACHVNFTGCYPKAEYERTVELDHPLESGSTLAVATASGSIDIAGRETEQCDVIATIRARAASEEEAQELAEQVTIRFEQTAEKLEIKADRPRQLRNKSLSISYNVTTPHQTHIQCNSASGSVELSDLVGNVDGSTASGSVRGTGISGGNVTLHSASGGVYLSNGADLGVCDLRTASGGVKAEQVKAESISMHTASGSVRLADAQVPTATLVTSSGSVRAEHIDCAQVSAKSSSGSVSVEFSPSAPGNVTAELRCTSGRVTLVTPPEFAGRMDLSTTSGSIHSDLPISVQGRIDKKHISGTVGEGTGNVSIHTSSGSIHVR
jgi:DUF4097 and DUF4098 domain-containing protein YvlB